MNNSNVDSDMAELKSVTSKAIVFYNVENLFDTENDPRTNDDDFTPYGKYSWDEYRYVDKLSNLAEALDAVNGTLIGLAEVENRTVLEDLVKQEKLQASNFEIVHYDSPDNRGIDCALLYNPAYYKLVESRPIRVQLENLKTRDILYAEMLTKDDVKMHVFVNHWSSRREGKEETEFKRLFAAEVLREEIDQIFDLDNDANIIVFGDFNDHPDDKSLEDVLRAKKNVAGKLDLINLLFDEHQKGVGTAKHQREWMIIDQIIVSQSVYLGKNGIGLQDVDSEIFDDDRLLYTYPDGSQKPNATYGGRKYYGGYSDHLPVYAILK